MFCKGAIRTYSKIPKEQTHQYPSNFFESLDAKFTILPTILKQLLGHIELIIEYLTLPIDMEHDGKTLQSERRHGRCDADDLCLQNT